MRVLLYEPDHEGHHYPYLARLLPGIVDLPGVRLTLATTQAGIDSEQFGSTLAPFADRLDITTDCTRPPPGVIANGRHRYKELVRATRNVQPDHIWVLYADALWQIMQVHHALGRRPFKDIPLEAWAYRGGLAYPGTTRPVDKASRYFFKRAVNTGPFTVLHLDDELLFDYAQRHQYLESPPAPRLVLTPNPVDLKPPLTKHEARAQLGVPTDGRYITSSGMISDWKGMDRLIRAFVIHAESHPDDRLLLGGPHEEPIPSLLKQPAAAALKDQGRILSIDRFISSDEMFAVAAAGDLTVAAYPNHSGRSSIILWSAAAGRPVLGAERGCIGHVVRTQNLGLTFNVFDDDAFVRMLGEALDQPWTDGDATRVRAYAETHSFENYRRSGSRYLRERLDQPEYAEAQAVTP